MRKKISLGFISLAILLLFAGAISVYELTRLRRQARQVIELNAYNVSVAERMMSALQAQNSSILQMVFSGNTIPGAGFREADTAFNEALKDAETTAHRQETSIIHTAYSDYHNVIASHLNDEYSENLEWFLTKYLQAYYSLDESVKAYLISPKASLSTRAEMLEKNVYKTITPSILTLLIALFLVLLLYFFIDSYYVKPLLKINKSLQNYLKTRIPFNPSFESNNDELNSMKDMIEEVIEQKRN